MPHLTRDAILASTSTFRTTAIDIPALGGSLHVRPLSVGGMARYLACKDPASQHAIMIADTVCDESGARLFSPADESALSELPATVAQAILEVVGENTNPTPQETAGN